MSVYNTDIQSAQTETSNKQNSGNIESDFANFYNVTEKSVITLDEIHLTLKAAENIFDPSFQELLNDASNSVTIADNIARSIIDRFEGNNGFDSEKDSLIQDIINSMNNLKRIANDYNSNPIIKNYRIEEMIFTMDDYYLRSIEFKYNDSGLNEDKRLYSVPDNKILNIMSINRNFGNIRTETKTFAPDEYITHISYYCIGYPQKSDIDPPIITNNYLTAYWKALTLVIKTNHTDVENGPVMGAITQCWPTKFLTTFNNYKNLKEFELSSEKKKFNEHTNNNKTLATFHHENYYAQAYYFNIIKKKLKNSNVDSAYLGYRKYGNLSATGNSARDYNTWYKYPNSDLEKFNLAGSFSVNQPDYRNRKEHVLEIRKNDLLLNDVDAGKRKHAFYEEYNNYTQINMYPVNSVIGTNMVIPEMRDTDSLFVDSFNFYVHKYIIESYKLQDYLKNFNDAYKFYKISKDNLNEIIDIGSAAEYISQEITNINDMATQDETGTWIVNPLQQVSQETEGFNNMFNNFNNNFNNKLSYIYLNIKSYFSKFFPNSIIEGMDEDTSIIGRNYQSTFLRALSQNADKLQTSLENQLDANKRLVFNEHINFASELANQKNNVASNIFNDYLINDVPGSNAEQVYNKVNQDNNNKKRKIQITKYYTKTYKEYVHLLKTVIILIILMIPILIFNRLELIGKNITLILVTSVLFLGFLYIFYRLYLLYMKDPKDFDKNKIPYDRQARELVKQGAIKNKNSPLKSFGITCIGDECCDVSMIYDKLNNKCVQVDGFGNYFDNYSTLTGNNNKNIIEKNNIHEDNCTFSLLNGTNVIQKNIIENFVRKYDDTDHPNDHNIKERYNNFLIQSLINSRNPDYD